MNKAILLVALVGTALAGCADSPEALRNKGVREFQAGRAAQAKKLFSEAYATRPWDVETLFYLGRIAQSEGRLGLAKYYYESCLDVDPGYAKARDFLARVKADQARSAAIP